MGVAALLAALGGCTPPHLAPPPPEPVAAPPPPSLEESLPLPDSPVPPPPPLPTERSAESLQLEKHYARVQADLEAQGLLRTDGGGPDTPFAVHNLVENFIRIALFDEYDARSGTLVAQQTASQLRRWEQPVRLGLTFGPTIGADERARDSAILAAYAARLARVSGHPVSVTTPENANFNVLVLNEDERRAFGPELSRLVPGIDPVALRTIETLPRETYCLAIAFSNGGVPTYTRAVAVIRGEHPDLLRQSCFHEEIAQGLGLANDSPMARPSIFNDDEEFALLTTQDELMLKILYDPRLRPGMTAAEAEPIVTQIATELIGGDS